MRFYGEVATTAAGRRVRLTSFMHVPTAHYLRATFELVGADADVSVEWNGKRWRVARRVSQGRSIAPGYLSRADWAELRMFAEAWTTLLMLPFVVP